MEGFSRERTQFDGLYGIMEGNMETHKKDVAIIQVKDDGGWTQVVAVWMGSVSRDRKCCRQGILVINKLSSFLFRFVSSLS